MDRSGGLGQFSPYPCPSSGGKARRSNKRRVGILDGSCIMEERTLPRYFSRRKSFTPFSLSTACFIYVIVFSLFPPLLRLGPRSSGFGGKAMNVVGVLGSKGSGKWAQNMDDDGWGNKWFRRGNSPAKVGLGEQYCCRAPLVCRVWRRKACRVVWSLDRETKLNHTSIV